MRLRLSSIDEFQLLTCFKHGLWGAKMDRFPGWEQGDYLLLTVNKSLAALAQINGKPFKSNERVWDNGLYPYRIPIKFLSLLRPHDRPLLLGEIRDVLTSVWGPTSGWGILNQQLLEGDVAEKLVLPLKLRPTVSSILRNISPANLRKQRRGVSPRLKSGRRRLQNRSPSQEKLRRG